jgi:hypothetical protein
MGTLYEQDVMAWASEQAALLRAGKLAAIDIEHIAQEIEDVGKSEKRELASTWADAVTKAIDETGLDTFPEDCPWAMAQVLMQDFLPQG